MLLRRSAGEEGREMCVKAGKEMGILEDGMKDIKRGRIMKSGS